MGGPSWTQACQLVLPVPRQGCKTGLYPAVVAVQDLRQPESLTCGFRLWIASSWAPHALQITPVCSGSIVVLYIHRCMTDMVGSGLDHFSSSSILSRVPGVLSCREQKAKSPTQPQSLTFLTLSRVTRNQSCQICSSRWCLTVHSTCYSLRLVHDFTDRHVL